MEDNQPPTVNRFDASAQPVQSKKSKKRTFLVAIAAVLFASSLAVNGFQYYESTLKSDETSAELNKQGSQQAEQSVKDSIADPAVPAGFLLYENADAGISFLWPTAWGEPTVKFGPIDEYVVDGDKHSNDMKYNKQAGYWVTASNDVYSDEVIGEFTSIDASSVLLKTQAITIYEFGFGDAGCIGSVPTVVTSETIVQVSVPVTCNDDQGISDTRQMTINGESKAIDSAQFKTDTSTFLTSIKTTN